MELKQICLHKTNGHQEIEFHIIVEKNGGLKYPLKLDKESPATKFHTKGVIAIGVEGEFITEEVTEQQMNTLKVLILNLCKQYNIGTTMHHIFCHCDYRDPPGDRLCPGKHLHRKIPELGKSVYLALRNRV